MVTELGIQLHGLIGAVMGTDNPTCENLCLSGEIQVQVYGLNSLGVYTDARDKGSLLTFCCKHSDHLNLQRNTFLISDLGTRKALVLRAGFCRVDTLAVVCAVSLLLEILLR